MDPGSGGIFVRKTLNRREIAMPKKTVFEMKVSLPLILLSAFQ